MIEEITMKNHWNEVYSSKSIEKLGWYEDVATQSLNLIKKCSLRKDEEIIDVGCGASLLIDNLINEGFRKITATDISKNAIGKLKKRLGKEKASQVRWIVDDLTSPKELTNLNNISLWHDRAVLHFLTKVSDRQIYRKILTGAVKVNGYVIIASFSLKGAKKCSGLDVRRWDKKLLSEFLGSDFHLIEHFDYVYQMPSEDLRPYVYTLFQRVK